MLRGIVRLSVCAVAGIFLQINLLKVDQALDMARWGR